MDMKSVEIQLPQDMLKTAERMARQDDVTIGQIIRDLLRKDISRRQGQKPMQSAEELHIAPLRARLAGDLASARGWEDLQARLRGKGFVLREAGGGLALCNYPSNDRVCKASELGFSYSRLMRRFGAPFPTHTHSWQADKMLNNLAVGLVDDMAEFEPEAEEEAFSLFAAD